MVACEGSCATATAPPPCLQVKYRRSGAGTFEREFGYAPRPHAPWSYPQTGVGTPLPMFPPYDTLRLLAAGGSAADYADAGTPASDAAHVIEVRRGGGQQQLGGLLGTCLQSARAPPLRQLHRSPRPRCTPPPCTHAAAADGGRGRRVEGREDAHCEGDGGWRCPVRWNHRAVQRRGQGHRGAWEGGLGDSRHAPPARQPGGAACPAACCAHPRAAASLESSGLEQGARLSRIQGRRVVRLHRQVQQSQRPRIRAHNLRSSYW